MNLKKYVLPLGICLAVVGMSVFGVDCFADSFTPEQVAIEPLVDFGSFKEELMGFVGPVVAGAIGIGLAVWGTRFLFRIVKSMARG